MSPLFPYAHLFRAYVPVGSRLRSAPPPRGATRNRRKGPPPAFPPRPSAGPPPSAHLTDGRCGALRRSPSPLFRLRVDMSLDRLQIGRKRLEPLLAIEQDRDPREGIGRPHVRTPVTNAHLVFCLPLEQNKHYNAVYSL